MFPRHLHHHNLLRRKLGLELSHVRRAGVLTPPNAFGCFLDLAPLGFYVFFLSLTAHVSRSEDLSLTAHVSRSETHGLTRYVRERLVRLQERYVRDRLVRVQNFFAFDLRTSC